MLVGVFVFVCVARSLAFTGGGYKTQGSPHGSKSPYKCEAV